MEIKGRKAIQLIWIFALCIVFYLRTRHVEGALFIFTAILLAALLGVIIFGFPMVDEHFYGLATIAELRNTLTNISTWFVARINY